VRKLAFYGLAALMGGCVPVVSLHPLFTKETVAFDEKLLGTWADDAYDPDATWQFSRLEEAAHEDLPEALKETPKKLYRLRLTDDEGRSGSFVACMVRLGEHRFLDVYPDTYPSGQNDMGQTKMVYNAFLFLRVHTIVRIQSLGNELKLRLTNDEGLAKLIDAEPGAVGHEVVDDRSVLTASTEELQAFVVKYADDERLFPGKVDLVRRNN
jgi:hypothetical protein